LKQETKAAYHSLVNKEIHSRIPGLQGGDLAGMLPYCQEAVQDPQPDPLAVACLVECLVESPDGLKKAREAVAMREIAMAGGYGFYAQGRLLAVEKKLGESIASFEEALKTKDWQNDERKTKVADAYFQAARGLPAADKNRAFEWYDQAVKLSPAPPIEYKIELARAAVAKPVPAPAVANRVTSELLKDPSVDLGSYGFEVLRLHAQTQPVPEGAGGALADYHKILDLARDGRLPNVTPADLLEKVVQPAVQVGKDWVQAASQETDRHKQLAYFHGYEGRLLWDNLYGILPVKQELRVARALEAYRAAAEEYPREQIGAGYLMWEGFLLTQRPPVDVKRLHHLAELARKAAPDFSAGAFLDGLAYYYDSLEAWTDWRDGLSKEEKALKALDRAIELSQNNKAELLDQYYTFRSAVNVYKANALDWLQAPKAECQKCLQQAYDDADKVVREFRPSHPWHAYLQMGNALEDLALFCALTDKYGPAIRAFDQSVIHSNRLEPMPLISRGRTTLRRYVYADRNPEFLTEAKSYLKEGYAAARLRNNKTQQAEAQFWLAQSLLAEPNVPDVHGVIQAINLGIDLAPPSWLGLARTTIAYEIQTAQDLRELNADTAGQLARAVRAHCKAVSDKSDAQRFQTISLLDRSWRLEAALQQIIGNDDRAQAAYQADKDMYDAALSQKPGVVSQEVELLLGRSELLTQIDSLRSQDLQREKPQSIQDAEQALATAKKAHLDDAILARASFQAGKAWGWKFTTAQSTKFADY